MALGLLAGAGAFLDFGLGLWNTYQGQKNFEAQNKLAREQYDFAKTQYGDSVNRYNTTLANQQKGINAIGSSFSEAFTREKANVQTPTSADAFSSTPPPLETPQPQSKTQNLKDDEILASLPHQRI